MKYFAAMLAIIHLFMPAPILLSFQSMKVFLKSVLFTSVCPFVYLFIIHSFSTYQSPAGCLPLCPAVGITLAHPSVPAFQGFYPSVPPLSVTDVPPLSCWFVPTQLIKMLQSSSSSPFFCHLTFPLLHQASKGLPTVPEVLAFLQNPHSLGTTLLAMDLPKSLHYTL